MQKVPHNVGQPCCSPKEAKTGCDKNLVGNNTAKTQAEIFFAMLGLIGERLGLANRDQSVVTKLSEPSLSDEFQDKLHQRTRPSLLRVPSQLL